MVVYDLVGGLGFPLANTGMAISTTPLTRLLARLLVALGAAVGASALLTSDTPRGDVTPQTKTVRPRRE